MDENSSPSRQRLSLSVKRLATQSSLLVRGQNCCGHFCRCVTGLFKESDSLFCNGELFLFKNSSLFMVHKPLDARNSKCAKKIQIYFSQ